MNGTVTSLPVDTHLYKVMPAWKGAQPASAEPPHIAPSHPQATCTDREQRSKEKTKAAPLKMKPSLPAPASVRTHPHTPTTPHKSSTVGRPHPFDNSTVSEGRSSGKKSMSRSVESSAKELSKSSAKDPSKSSAKQPSSAKEPSKSSAKEASKSSAKDPSKSSAKEPSKSSAKEASKSSAKEPSKSSAKEPSKSGSRPQPVQPSHHAHGQSAVVGSHPERLKSSTVSHGSSAASSSQRQPHRSQQQKLQHSSSSRSSKDSSLKSSDSKNGKTAVHTSSEHESEGQVGTVSKSHSKRPHADTKVPQSNAKRTKKGPGQGSSAETHEKAVEKRLCQSSSLDAIHEKAVEKRHCQELSSDNTNEKAVEKKPYQSSSLDRDAKAVENSSSSKRKEEKPLKKRHSSSQHKEKKADQKRPCQGLSLFADNGTDEKGPSPGISEDEDEETVQKGQHHQGSSLHTDKKASQKGPQQGSSLHTDKTTSQKGPHQGSSVHSNKKASQKGPHQSSSVHTDKKASEKGPYQGSSVHIDKKASHKGPHQGSSVHTDKPESQKGPHQGSPQHTDKKVSQKGHHQGSSLHTDKPASQKGSHQGSPQHTDKKIAQKGPHQGSSVHTDKTASQKGPHQGSSQHIDKKSTQKAKETHRSSSVHRDKRAAEKGPCQGSPQHTDKKITQKGTSQGSEPQSDYKASQKRPHQGSALKTDSRDDQRGLHQGSSLKTNKDDQKRPHQGSALKTDSRDDQKGPLQGSSLRTNKDDQKGPHQGSSPKINKDAQKRPHQGSSLKTDSRDDEKGLHQGSSLKTNKDDQKRHHQSSALKTNRDDQKGPHQGSSLKTDSRDDQKGLHQGSSLKTNKDNQKRPHQSSSAHSTSKASQKGHHQGSSEHSHKKSSQKTKGTHRSSSQQREKKTVEKGPSQGSASKHADKEAVEKGPCQGSSSQHKENVTVQKGHCKGSPSKHTDDQTDQDELHQGSSTLNTDTEAVQTGLCQDSSLSEEETEEEPVEEGDGQGISQHTNNGANQKGLCQGSTQHSENEAIQKSHVHLSNKVLPEKTCQESVPGTDKIPRKRPSKGVLVCTNEEEDQMGPNQGSSRCADKRMLEKAVKGPSQGSALCAESNDGQKGHCQSSVSDKDNTAAQERPCQGINLDEDNTSDPKGPYQGAPLSVDNKVTLREPCKGSPQDTANRTAHKKHSQEPPLYAKSKVVQKEPFQVSVADRSVEDSQKGPCEELFLDGDNEEAQKGPSQGPLIETNNGDGENGTPSLHKNYNIDQEGTLQGLQHCTDDTNAWKTPCEELVLHKDNEAAQKGPSQGSALHKEDNLVRPSQGTSFHTSPKPCLQGPCQGSEFIHPTLVGPHKGSSVRTNIRDTQNLSCEGLSHHNTNKSGPQQGPHQELPLEANTEGVQKGLFQGTSLNINKAALKRPCQGSPLNTENKIGQNDCCQEPQPQTDCKLIQQGPCQGVPLHINNRTPQQGPHQGIVQYDNHKPIQKDMCQGVLPYKNNRTLQQGPSQGAMYNTENKPVQQGPCQGALVYSNNKLAQQGPFQGVNLPANNRTVPQGPCQGSSQHSLPTPTQKGPCQGLTQNSLQHPILSQKGPNPGPQTTNADNKPAQGAPIQRFPTGQQARNVPEASPPSQTVSLPQPRPLPPNYRIPLLSNRAAPTQSSVEPRSVLWPFSETGHTASYPRPVRPPMPGRRHEPPLPSDSRVAPPGGSNRQQGEGSSAPQGDSRLKASPHSGGGGSPSVSSPTVSGVNCNPRPPPPWLNERAPPGLSLCKPLLQHQNKILQACPNPRAPLYAGQRMPQPGVVSVKMPPHSVAMSQVCPNPRPFTPSDVGMPRRPCMPPCLPNGSAQNSRPPRPQMCHRPVPQPYPRLPPPRHAQPPQSVSALLPPRGVFRPLPLPHGNMPLSELVQRPPPLLPHRPRIPGTLGPVFRPPLRPHGRLPLPYPPTRPLHPSQTLLPLPKPPVTATMTSDSSDPIHLQAMAKSASKQVLNCKERSTDSSAKFPTADGGNFPTNPFTGLSIKGNWCTVPKELGHGDKDERTYIHLEPSLKMMFSFDVDNPVKWTFSPDQRRSHSLDGSCMSDSMSTKTDKTDTDSSCRNTPMSWDFPNHLKTLPSSSCTSMCFCHKFNSSSFFRDGQESHVASDSASSKDGCWDAESVELNQEVAGTSGLGGRPYNGTLGGCGGVRETGFKCHCQACSPGDHIRRVGWKRPREGSPLSDPDLDWEERLWRTAAKRLRLNGEEVELQTEAKAAEESKADDTPSWTRSSPADLYFTRTENGNLDATDKMKDLEDTFEERLLKHAKKDQPPSEPVSPQTSHPPPHAHHHHHHNHHHHHHHHPHHHHHNHHNNNHHRHHCHHHRRRRRHHSSCSSSSSSSESDSEDGSVCNSWVEEMDRKRKHPYSLHSELWYNDPGEMNNGPLCRCSIRARKTGIRHNVYPGEEVVEACDPASNNLKQLHHYRITMSPSTNFLTNSPSVITFDNHEFIFEGFSLFTHEKLDNVPVCKVIRFHIEYTIHFIEEQVPENFTIRSLDLVTQFLFKEVLELVDLDWIGPKEGCQLFHIMPRFARLLPENGKEILSMNEVLKFLIRSSRPLISESDLPVIQNLDKDEWQSWVEKVCGMIVTYPGKKPTSIRVDQLDRTKLLEGEKVPPILVHFGIRPAQLSYAGDPTYQKAWKHYIKFKHLLNSKPKVSREDKLRLKLKEAQLQEIQRKSNMKREVTVELSTEGFLRTGLKSDICQHALLLPVLISHIRFHSCLAVLEDHLQYSFQDRSLLQLALTHTSFRCNYGTNPAHARNSLTNCGLRQVEYGDRRIYYQNTRKRGINILVDIMSRMGRKEETPSDIPHNERLEFLGDAVIEFLSSVHLFFMFPWLEEGGLSTYRTAIVQNQHLAILAENLRLQDFMLFVHGPDLCHESDLRHAMANCFEALMGALFLDGGLDVVDHVFARTLFEDEHTCFKTWLQLPLHPLQEDEPGGDRHWVESSPALQKLISFEERIGVTFGHIRLLAKAFTHRNVGYNILTMGHNQRLEFLGDTVLQLIASEYLYKHFPEHHEGHLSLLRSSLVNSRTQAIVCDDLGMLDFVIYNNAGTDKFDMKTKQKADLLEAVLGALYVDSGMEFCKVFCDVCFFPRLKDFILNQDWNDPKSQLQQCCLTLRKMGAGEPDIPVYKVIESLGPSNTRKYIVAVYFRGERMATGTGHSIQQAEMSAATNALKMRPELFPILQHQRRFLRRRYKNLEWNDTKPNNPYHSRYNNTTNNNDNTPTTHITTAAAAATTNATNATTTTTTTTTTTYYNDNDNNNDNINLIASSPAPPSSPSYASSVSSLPIRQA